MEIKEKVAEILLEVNALNVDIANPYKYDSGILSPVYTDCRVIISYPEKRKQIIGFFEDALKKLGEKFDVIAAAGPDAISFASYLSKAINIPMIFVRKAKKQHGKQKQIEGKIKKGDNVLIMKDIISTGETLKESIVVLREEGCIVDYCLSVFNNNIKESNEELEELKVKNISLLDLDTLLLAALAHKKINNEELDQVHTWVKNPSEWILKRDEDKEDSLDKNERRTAEILLEKKAVTLDPKKPFRYVSGVYAPIYTDCRLLISFPDEWQEIIKSLAYIIKNKIGLNNIEILAGTAIGAIPHAALLAEELNLPMVYVNKVERQSGKQAKIEGVVSKGDNILVVEDLISTGGSSITTVNSLREPGGLVKHCIAIFNYGFPATENIFKEVDVKLHSLCSLRTLLEVAVEKKYIKTDDKEIVEEWIKDPESWGKKMGFETKDQ